MYYYLRNGQNDIMGILNSSGVQVVSYVYDSWGNPISTTGTSAATIGADNPFRYRGYYFDSDTGLYYLNSRYYDSAVGRFINADGLVSASSTLLGTNMYGYCENNPVDKYDSDGEFVITATLVYLGVSAVAAMTLFAMSYHSSSGVGVQSSYGLSNLGDNFNRNIRHIGNFVNQKVSWLNDKIKALWPTKNLNGTNIVEANGKSNPHDLEKGMTTAQKGIFQRLIEAEKRSNGMGPKDNLPWFILAELADEARKACK